VKAIELYRKDECLLAASDDAIKVVNRMEEGEATWFKPIRVRDLSAHRRYWKLMTMCAENCDHMDLPYGGSIEIHSKDDVHTAIKICTGHVTWILDSFGKERFAVPKSTDFESMTADEWNEYWPKVLDVVAERIMPGIQQQEVEYELQKCMGWAR
jgi:hypothetical protein